MLTSVWEDIKREFRAGNPVTRLIIVNVAVFVVIRLIALVFWLVDTENGSVHFQDFLHEWLCASYQWKHILTKPWTIISYMFLHYDLWHLIFNMLFLYWFGRIFRDLGGSDRILATYIYGGLVGFIVYVITGLLLSSVIAPYALGASAGVMAIVIATAVLAPEYSMHLLLIGPVKLKYIALALVFLDLILMPGGNTGGHFAHLGGMAMGAFMVIQLREKGNDLAVPFNNFTEKMLNFFGSLGDRLKRKRRPKVVYKNPKMQGRAKGNAKTDLHIVPDQAEVDAILDKIKIGGYDSLTKAEKDTLAKASKS